MHIVFCGVGAVGSTAAVACRNLDATLCFVDFDRVESKNVLAQAFVKQSVGKNKADALKLQLRNFYDVKAESFGVKLTVQNAEQLCARADLLIDGFDNIASRQVLSDLARARELPLVHGALSGDGSVGLVRWDERFSPDAEDETGQATCEGGEHLPIIALLGATLARAVQDYVLRDQRHDYLVNLGGVQRTD